MVFVVLSSFLTVAPEVSASPTGVDWFSISAGFQHTCALDNADRISCWGRNQYGQLGNGTTDQSDFPKLIKTTGALAGVQFKQVSASYTHTCALTVDGVAYCWGLNDQGQLGNPDVKTQTAVPVAVDTSGDLNGVVLTSIDTGINHTCALSDAGTVYCWGANDNGQIGNGTLVDSPTPVAVDTSGVLSGITVQEISVGSLITCVLDTSGLVYCWGYGPEGEMGDGLGRGNNPFPVAVDTTGVLSGISISHISAGDSAVCAVDSNGLVYCWGLNASGQLGNGTTDDALSPVQVNAEANLSSQSAPDVSVGGAFACARTDMGLASCWGDGSQGQLGNAATNDSNVPVDVWQSDKSVLKDVTFAQLSAGYSHTCVISTVARAYCWGLNDYGQLGTGVDSSDVTGVPVEVLHPSAFAPVFTKTTDVVAYGVRGRKFSDSQVAARSKGASLTFSIKSGALPNGLIINSSTGVISGIPKAQGTTNFVVKVANSGGSAAIKMTVIVTSPTRRSPSPSPSPSASGINISDDIGVSGKARGMILSADGHIYPRITSQFVGPITGSVIVTYRNQTTLNTERWICRLDAFGQLGPVKKSGKTFKQRDYVSKKGCALPKAAKAAILKEKITVNIRLLFSRRWPTTYSQSTPAGKKMPPFIYNITVTAGAGRIGN